jgi:hypothetical protein
MVGSEQDRIVTDSVRTPLSNGGELKIVIHPGGGSTRELRTSQDVVEGKSGTKVYIGPDEDKQK